ncbi:hypothetical protein EG68_10641 [Paragonimus skrjabini miyazakii]|uniref:Ig-like domain-containing protein n=1 Tax=Paragonimus skrjabini miyazakii TaxID=59628 RepID=A0A8S9YG00_9TREM|nr:hypothetical protein EG68_10641 [Paragonimus skrjabini miyazakii]
MLFYSELLFLKIIALLATVTAKTSIYPPGQSIPVGNTGQFLCTSTVRNLSVIWHLLNNETLTNGSSSADGRFVNHAGKLSMNLLTLKDSGSYYCTDPETDRTRSRDGLAFLRVYIMPAYKTEGIIALSVNAVLLLLFIGCVIHAGCQYRKKEPFPSF